MGVAGILQGAGNALDAFGEVMEFGSAHGGFESIRLQGGEGRPRQALRLNRNSIAPMAISTPPKTRFCARRARTLRSMPCSRAASQA